MDRRNFLKAFGLTSIGSLIPFRVTSEEKSKEKSIIYLKNEWYSEIESDEFLKLKILTNIDTLYIDVPTKKIVDFENECIVWIPYELGNIRVDSIKTFTITDILVTPPLEIKESFKKYGIDKDWSYCNKRMNLRIPKNSNCILTFNKTGLFRKM